MKTLKFTIFYFVFLTFSLLSSTEFTISTYNCGGLSDHYDYLRAAGMQKVMQERYIAEPESMSLNEKIQKLALKILFSPDSQDGILAKLEWDRNGYQHLVEHLTAIPTDHASPNTFWNHRVDEVMTSYKIRPIVIHDHEVTQQLNEHLRDLSEDMEVEITNSVLEKVRTIMAKRIFAHHLKHDIICLQEADYLDDSMFPRHYEVLFAETSHSKNGIAWNKDRFDLIASLGNILGRAFAVQLLDKESGKKIVVASGHLSGCNPYRIAKDPLTVTIDSEKGDTELQTILQLFESQDVDLMMIGMDSNVTSLHPRLAILKNAGYQMDDENFLEPTCTNPHQVLNTRIDWIAIKAKNGNAASITNIPVLNVGLNSIQTNISDHKPIAAKINL